MGFTWTHITQSTLAFLIVFGALVFVAGVFLIPVPFGQSVSLSLRIFGGFMFGTGFFVWLFKYILGWI